MVICSGCNRPLPLVDAPEEELAGWACAHCGTVYRAAIDPRSTEDERRMVALLERTRRVVGMRVSTKAAE
jgi:hypothetical protein